MKVSSPLSSVKNPQENIKQMHPKIQKPDNSKEPQF